jgi:hypothetical protein
MSIPDYYYKVLKESHAGPIIGFSLSDLRKLQKDMDYNTDPDLKTFIDQLIKVLVEDY